jgi:addiction module HigA family antidote
MSSLIFKQGPQPVPAHPGDMLKSCIAEKGKSVAEVATAIGVTRQTLHRIIAGKASYTPDMALRLERYFGYMAEMWLRAQINYDLVVTANRMEDVLSGIKHITKQEVE